jgi:hypothetical protein
MEKTTERKQAPGASIKEVLGKALEGRAKELGLSVKNVTGLGMTDVEGQKQPMLFGEYDGIVNVLELDVKDIKAEILKCREMISRKESEICILENRLKDTAKALESARKMGTAKKTEDKPTETKTKKRGKSPAEKPESK